MSGTVAAVYVVRAENRPGELLCEKVHLIGCLGTREQSRCRTGIAFESCRCRCQSRIPVCRLQLAVDPNHRRGQPLISFTHLSPPVARAHGTTPARKNRLDDAAVTCPAGELVAVGELELAQDGRDVGFYGFGRDVQASGDLFVLVAAGDLA